MSKNILVLLKIYKGDLNPFDECALECALSYPESKVTVLAMSPLSHLETLENLTRLGCDAILVSDKLYAGSDTIATTKVLAKTVELYNPDLIFCGRQSIDGNTAQVPIMLSELTGYKLVNKVISIERENAKTREDKSYVLGNKQLLTFEKFKLLRAPSIFSKKREVRIITNEELDLPVESVGLFGSPTQVIKSYANETDRRFCKFINFSKLDEIVYTSLIVMPDEKVEKVNKAPLIHYVGNLNDVALKYGEQVQEIKVDGLSIDEVIKLIEKIKPKIILWEEREYKQLAARVAIRMNVGLCADCVSFNYVKNQFIITRPALGGDVIADIVSKSPISMATIKATNTEEYGIAIVIGRGTLHCLKHMDKIADDFRAKIYCTRPLADSGVIDYSHQVGLTGISIAPRVCIVIGTSGAVQNIVGINKSKTIIAINNDKKAKIFDYSDYGIIMDAKDI